MDDLKTNTLTDVRPPQHHSNPGGTEPGTALRHAPWVARHRPSVAEWTLYVSVSLCILDGAIRKWLLRDFVGLLQYAPYFGKDIALIVIVLFCKRSPSRSESAAPLLLYLQIGVTLVALGAATSVAMNLNALNLVGASLTVLSLVFLPIL